jgi:fibronectin-binding autotransporter adhesin
MPIEMWIKTLFRRRRALRVASLCGILATCQIAQGADVTWLGEESSDWATAENWDTGALPTVGDVALINNGGLAEISTDVGIMDDVLIDDGEVVLGAGGALTASFNAAVGTLEGFSGTLTQTGGDLTIDDLFFVGDVGDGTYTISGGTVIIGNGDDGDAFLVGFPGGGVGTVEISGDAEVFSTTAFAIRNGTVTQTGGTISSQSADYGLAPGGTGLYSLSGGVANVDGFASIGSVGSMDGTLEVSGDATLNVGIALQVGGETFLDENDEPLATSGQLIQTGGLVSVPGQLQVGAGPASVGVYELQGGTLEVQAVSFIAASAAEVAPGELLQAEGTFNQSGGEAIFNETVLVSLFGLAELNQSSGTAVYSPPVPTEVGVYIPSFILGYTSDSVSVANFSGGDTEFTDTVLIGEDGDGEFNQTGGVINVNTTSDPNYIVQAYIVGTDGGNAASMNLSGGTNNMVTALVVGDQFALRGIVNVSGTAEVNVGEEFIIGGFVGGDTEDEVYGEVNQSGGQVTAGFPIFLGLLRNDVTEAKGVYNLSGGVLNAPSGIAVGYFGRGEFTQTGGVFNATGGVFIGDQADGSGVYRMQGGVLELGRSVISPGGGSSSFEFTGGRVSGAAQIGLSFTQSGGTLSTGAEPGITEIIGDYEITGDGVLEVKLGGSAVVSEYDFFYVEGAATLGGTLSVLLTNDFTPQIGDLFEIMESASGSITGTFDSVAFAANPGNLTGQVIYESDRVFLEIIQGQAGQIGDTNNDGIVDLDDLNNVRNNFGGTEGGDTFPFDGVVDLDDLNAVRNNFGAGQSPVSAEGETDVSGIPRVVFDRYGNQRFVYDLKPALENGRRGISYDVATQGGSLQAVPEPGSLALGAISVLAGAFIAYRRKR